MPTRKKRTNSRLRGVRSRRRRQRRRRRQHPRKVSRRKTMTPKYRRTHRTTVRQRGGGGGGGGKSSRNKRKWKTVKCSAGRNSLPYTCYSPKKLHKMKDFWNARHPDVPIKTNNTKTIWESLKKKLEPTCSQEMCWMEQQFMKRGVDKELRDFTFAPRVPDTWKKKSDEWLSSIDILRVMSQYEHEYPCFEFLGPSPIDYDHKKVYNECVWDELCNFSLSQHLENGKRKIGIIFNLDPHYKEGSHWVALFIYIPKEYMNEDKRHTQKAGIYYFDSYGDKPEPQINKFINTVIRQGRQLHIPFSKKVNTKRHQYSESECGMFSMYFIIKMLMADGNPKLANNCNDEMFKNVSLNGKIPDTHMKKLRKLYFNWE